MLFKIVAEDYVSNKRYVAHITADDADNAVRNYSLAHDDRYVLTVDLSSVAPFEASGLRQCQS